MRVFGSIARGEDRVDSDLDLLVDMEDDRSPLGLVALAQISNCCPSEKVGTLTEASIGSRLRLQIAADARAL